MTDYEIDAAARAFAETATTLANALLAKLEAEAPEIVAKTQQVLAQGEKMELVLTMDPAGPEIRWQVVNDYGRVLPLMTVPARMPTRQ